MGLQAGGVVEAKADRQGAPWERSGPRGTGASRARRWPAARFAYEGASRPGVPSCPDGVERETAPTRVASDEREGKGSQASRSVGGAGDRGASGLGTDQTNAQPATSAIPLCQRSCRLLIARDVA